MSHWCLARKCFLKDRLILKIKFFTKGRAKQEKNISSTHTSTPLAPPKVFQFK
jgi:hypothetical protein